MFDDLPALREIIAQHGLDARKSLGQNFLLDQNITDKIARCAQERCGAAWEDVNAIEIGPGPGGLTRSMLSSGVRSVLAVEFDGRAVVALQSLVDAAGGALEVVQHDALEVDLTQMSDAPRVIVANLPYNIATPLLLRWLAQIRADHGTYVSMSLMFQKEVAERICAAPGTKAYGRLSVMAQWLCDAQIVYRLPPSAFTPAPKVESAVVHFAPRGLQDDAPEFVAVERVTAAAFSQRRKMIRSSLKGYMHALEELEIDGTRRAETLSVQEFLDIAAYSHSILN